MGWMVNATLRPLYPRESELYLLYRRLGGPQGPSQRVRKISRSPGFDLRTFQSAAIRYSDWANPDHMSLVWNIISK